MSESRRTERFLGCHALCLTSCARTWADGHSAAILQTDHLINAALLPLKGVRAHTGTSGSASAAASTPAAADGQLDPAAASTSGMRTRSQTAAARASSASTATDGTAIDGTSAGPSEHSDLPSLSSCASFPLFQLQRAITQRLNYTVLKEALSIPVDEATPARRAAATSAANRIGRGTNLFQASYAEAGSLTSMFAEAVHLWLGLPVTHKQCVFAPSAGSRRTTSWAPRTTT